MVFNMKFTVKKIFVMVTIMFIGLLINSTVFAANLNVQVNCNGKTIKMTSETPDMTWTINNMLPGQEDESTLTLENVGTKNVDVSLDAKIESGEDVVKIFDLKILKLKSNSGDEQELYNGKYSELKSVNVNLDTNQKETYKFVISLPSEAGNEYQGKECVVKLLLKASGKEDKPTVPVEKPQEESKEENKITTEKVVSPQTGEGIVLFIVAGVLIIAFIVFLITFFINRKDKKE